MGPPLRIGTRGSPLALVQARLVAQKLREAHGWGAAAIELVPMTTSGDMARHQPLAEAGGKIAWTRELDAALLEGRTDISVHSMKDVETFRPDEIVIAAVPDRRDPRDRLVGADTLEALAEGARVGTSSPRRAAQLLRRRPDLVIVPLHGNVATRLRKITSGEADATVLAAAGLDRLGQNAVGTRIENMLPAPAQGAIGVETRRGDTRLTALMGAIDDAKAHACVAAERRLLAALGGDCRSPIAALARMRQGKISLRAEILTEDGTACASGRAMFDPEDEDAPAALARDLLARAEPRLARLFGL